jgi:hypothetical protein
MSIEEGAGSAAEPTHGNGHPPLDGSSTAAKRVRPRTAVHGSPTRRHAGPIPQRRSQAAGERDNPSPGAEPAEELTPLLRRPITPPEPSEPRFTADAIGPFRQPWREQVFARIAVLDNLNAVLPPMPPPAASPPAVTDRLEVAWRAACEPAGLRPGPNRARMERAFGHMDEAQASLLERTPEPNLRGQLAGLVAHVRAHLPPSHPQRVAVETLGAKRRLDLDRRTEPVLLDDDERALIVDATRTASASARREHARLSSFCMIVNVASAIMFVLAAVTAALSAANPAWIPLCSQPDPALVVCPTGSATGVDATLAGTAQSGDVLVVMLLGLLAAAVTAAAAIRHIRGTSTPFAVPVALLALKLPTGALTAFLGLLLLNGEFVPGLSALDTSGQILAWALIFGAAQQLVTGLVDKRAQSVLDATGSAPMTSEKE